MLFASVTSLGLAWLVCRVLRRKAIAWRLVDVPNDRSSHVTPTPRGGGIGIIVGFLTGYFALGVEDTPAASTVLLVSACVLAVTGFIDDRFSLAVLPRLLIQVACAVAVVVLGGIAWPGESQWLNLLLMLLATLYLVWLANLYNFMDGIDGIAAVEAVSVLASAALIAWFGSGGSGEGGQDIGIWLLMGFACLGFLLWNWAPAKLFMGDVGSTYLGIMLGGWSILCPSVPLLSWVVLLAFFISDATVTLVMRLMRGDKIYQAHRDHLYQYLARRWGSHARVCLALLALNVVWLLPLAAAVSHFAANGLVSIGICTIAYLPIVAVVYNIARSGDHGMKDGSST
jgi:Fuc2NAc and GlcNAc transferase